MPARSLTNATTLLATDKDHIKEAMTKMYDYEKFGAPFRRGDRYFYFHNNGLQNHFVLYTQQSIQGEPSLLLDPSTLSADGTAALRTYALTEDGSKLAFGVSYAGSDWFTIYVRDVATATDATDKLEWCKFSSIAWKHDGTGFFYARYAPPASLAPAAASGAAVDAGTEVDAAANQKVGFPLHPR